MASLRSILKKGFAFARKADPLTSKIMENTKDLPGGSGAFRHAIETEGVSNNPYSREGASRWDMWAGGRRLSQNEDARAVGRLVGTALAAYFGAAAAANAGGGGAAATTGTSAAAPNTAGAVAGAGTGTAGTAAHIASDLAAPAALTAGPAVAWPAFSAGGASAAAGSAAGGGAAAPAAAPAAPAAAPATAPAAAPAAGPGAATGATSKASTGILGMSASDVGQLVLLGAALSGPKPPDATVAPEPFPGTESERGTEADLTGLTAQQRRRLQAAGRSGTIKTSPRGLGEVTSGNLRTRTLLGY